MERRVLLTVIMHPSAPTRAWTPTSVTGGARDAHGEPTTTFARAMANARGGGRSLATPAAPPVVGPMARPRSPAAPPMTPFARGSTPSTPALVVSAATPSAGRAPMTSLLSLVAPNATMFLIGAIAGAFAVLAIMTFDGAGAGSLARVEREPRSVAMTSARIATDARAKLASVEAPMGALVAARVAVPVAAPVAARVAAPVAAPVARRTESSAPHLAPRASHVLRASHASRAPRSPRSEATAIMSAAL